jgi:uncharacterized protein (UPF0216 family)
MVGSVSEEGVLKKLLQHMNSQVPSRRLRLTELLSMQDPHYVGRDGVEYAISKQEIGLIKDSLALLGISDIKLPILLMADSSNEQPAWKVEGEIECALVLHLLSKDSPETKDKIFLYAPHVATLRRLVPTATVCMFMP